jgi:hypothetical protein
MLGARSLDVTRQIPSRILVFVGFLSVGTVRC